MANSEDVPRTDFMETLTGLHIPDDLIISSLLRLPVKSLLRCKAVSKAWLSLISNPTFVASHLHRTSENNESFIIHRIQAYHNSVSLSHVDACSIDQPYFEGVLWRELFIVGSYNGIVCAVLKNRLLLGRQRDFLCSIGWDPRPRSVQPAIPFKFHIFLWNPVTKQCNLLPPLIYGRASIYLGFGFNPVANDYKVVRLAEDKKGWVDVEIYSTNTNSWKYIEHPPNVLPRVSVCDACVNGIVYWPSRNGMITFNLNDEVFCDYKFPANVEKTRDLEHGYMKITEMKDSLVVVMYSNDEEGDESKVNLWTIDNGIEEPWTLKFSFDVAVTIDYVHGYIYNSGDILFKSEDGGWLLYNSDNKETENVKVSIGTSETFRHIESLVSITGSEKLSEMLTKMEIEDHEAKVRFS